MDPDRPEDTPTEINFPVGQAYDIGIHECRVYFPDGRLKWVIPARTVDQVLADKMPFNLYITEKI